MKKFFRMVSAFLACVLLVCLVPVYAVGTDSHTGKAVVSVDPRDYPENSRERFVANMALQHQISYQEADLLEKASALVVPRASDEVLKYKTIDQRTGTIQGILGYEQDVNIATEVRYVYNRALGKVSTLEHVGAPIMYIPGVTSWEILGGDFNIEQYSKSARISRTTALTYEIEGLTITAGIDILSVSGTTQGCQVTTRAKTFVLNITEGMLDSLGETVRQ